MNKTLIVAVEEIRRTIFKRSFIFVLFSLPLFLAVTIVPGILLGIAGESDLPIGYVDAVGVLSGGRTPPAEIADGEIEIRPYPDENAAQQALDGGELQAYYLVPADFIETRHVTAVYRKRPDSGAAREFMDYLRFNLLDELPADLAWRAVAGSELAIRNPEGSRVFPGGGPPIGSVMPIALALAFGGLLLIGSGSLMSGVVDEKSNRTMEVVMTSISPSQLVTGKLIGIIFANLLQLAFWALIAVLAGWLAGSVFDLTWFQDPDPDWGSLLSVAAVAFPSYIFAAAVMFTLGATVVDAPEGQSLGSVLFLVLMAPLYALLAIAGDPHGTLAVALSLLPLTSILTIAMRNMLVVVPAWQVGASAAIQVVLAIGAIWLAGRAFRLGHLRYGKRLRLRELLRGSTANAAGA